ncbi:MAG: carbohydrate ABC transporter permease [Chloroflexota bacterium]|nr:carbohydrate ABC transporter permease [Chloroflexota bacterium]
MLTRPSRTTAARPATRPVPLLSWLTRKNHGWYVLAYVLLVLLSFWTIFPFYWQVATSLRKDVDLYSLHLALIPTALTLDHYARVFGPGSPFGGQFLNSAIVGVAVTLVAVAIGALAAYALSRMRFLGRGTLARVLVYAYLAPGTMLFIPLFVMLNNFGLRDSLFGLALTHLTFSVPFAAWLLMGYFKAIPLELEEAAMVDGASRLTALLRIILPLSGPAMVVVAVFAFTLSWNEFLYAFVLIQSPSRMTAPVGLFSYLNGDTTYWGQMMAAATVMSAPPLLLYFFGQRWVISGWTAGAVKG